MIIESLKSDDRHSEDIHDIITLPPSWLLKWGITLFFTILLMLFSLSAIIEYPDIVKAEMKINSVDAPKALVSKISGRLVKILVKEDQKVYKGQVLAFLESTANYEQVLMLHEKLKILQNELIQSNSDYSIELNAPLNLNLGELQMPYQSFYQSFLSYKSFSKYELVTKKKAFLEWELKSILSHRTSLKKQKMLQERDFQLAKQEYSIHQKLADQKVETRMELQNEESKFINKHYPLQQTELSMIENATNYSMKEKEIFDLNNQIREERERFIQAFNSFLSEMENWKSIYIIAATQDGNVTFMQNIQVNQFVRSGEEIFVLNAKNLDFFGDMSISQNSMGKISKGQQVLIKLNSYPFEEYGIIRGKIMTISEIPYKDSIFFSKVEISKNGFAELRKPIRLKNGMTAVVEIITENATLLERLIRSIKIFRNS